MTIHCGRCRKDITTEDDHFAKCDAWLMKEGTQMKSDRIVCPDCGKSFNLSAIAQHSCVEQAATQRLSRKMEKLLAQKRKKLPVDLSGHNAEVPEPASESVEDRSEQLRRMMQELNEIRKARIPSIVNAVMSALKSKRLKGKNGAWWAKRYNELGVQTN